MTPNGDTSMPHANGARTLGALPFLAGLCSYEDAARPGYSVEANVARLKRFNWVEQCLTDIAVTQMNAIPEWEIKGGLALHIHLDSQHAGWLQNRVAELRNPPHKFHVAPDAALDAFCQEALRSRGTTEVLIAVYRVIRPALREAYQEHYDTTNPLVDQPTRRFLRFILLEAAEQIAWGEAALEAVVNSEAERQIADAWETHLRAFLQAAGGIAGNIESDAASGATELPAPRARAVKAGFHTAPRRAHAHRQLRFSAPLGVCPARTPSRRAHPRPRVQAAAGNGRAGNDGFHPVAREG